jgi:hypothetical protein
LDQRWKDHVKDDRGTGHLGFGVGLSTSPGSFCFLKEKKTISLKLQCCGAFDIHPKNTVVLSSVLADIVVHGHCQGNTLHPDNLHKL